MNKYCMLKRELCPICRERPLAINYVRDGIYHFRSSCTSCIRKGRKLRAEAPSWFKSGYRKKDNCEKCGFVAKLKTRQLFVFYVDGNLKNNNWVNLKTVCANCQIELHNANVPWRPAPILPDF